MSDERHLKSMTVEDWRVRVKNFREQLVTAERELRAAEARAAYEAARAQALRT